MKSVLIAAYTCCPNRGSEPGNGWNWLTGYLESGYKVFCITSSKYRNVLDPVSTESQYQNLKLVYTDNRLSLKLTGVPILGIYLHYYYWIWKGRREVKKLIPAHKFNHAHHVTYSSIKFGTILYNLPIPVVLGPLGGGEIPHRSLRKYLGVSYYTLFVKNAVANLLSAVNPTVSRSIASASTILVSNDAADLFVKSYTDRATERMFDAGLSPLFKQPFVVKVPGPVLQILWVGRIMPRKGLKLALEAVAALPAGFNYRLTVVGDGSEKKHCQDFVHQSGLSSAVIFLNSLPYDQLHDIFRRSDIFLFPSLVDSCPMQVFEALAYGLPVVTLDHQGMKEQVDNNRGRKVAVNNYTDYPNALAENIVSLCGDTEEYKRCSQNAYQFGQQQLWRARINSFLTRYQTKIVETAR